MIALGNPLLCDDGAALAALRRLRTRRRVRNVDFVENYSSGMDLLDDLVDRDRVLVMDAVRTMRSEPGTCLEFALSDLDGTRQARLVDSHGLNLATVVETGRRFGYRIAAADARPGGSRGAIFTSFQELPSESVMDAMPDIVDRVERTLREWECTDGG